MISIGRPAIQSYANKVPAAMNLLGTQLAHLDKNSTPMTWTGIYTPGVPKISPASSPAATDAPTEILTATDDSAPKRKFDTLDSPSKKIKTEKYLVISSSEDEQQASEDEGVLQIQDLCMFDVQRMVQDCHQ